MAGIEVATGELMEHVGPYKMIDWLTGNLLTLPEIRKAVGKVKLSYTDKKDDTPVVREWLDKCEATIENELNKR